MNNNTDTYNFNSGATGGTHSDTVDAFFDDDFSDDAFTDDDFSSDGADTTSFSDDDTASFSDDDFSDNAFTYDDAVSAFSDEDFSDDAFTDDAFTDDTLPDDDNGVERSKDALSKAVVYARTGINGTEPNGTEPSIELQFEAATAHARMAGYTKVERVSDENTPDDELPFSRPGLRSALMALASGEASALAVSGVGRISLNMDILTLVFDCAQNDGWRLIVPGFTMTNDAHTGRFILNMLCEATKLNKAKAQTPLRQLQYTKQSNQLSDTPTEPVQTMQTGQAVQPVQTVQVGQAATIQRGQTAQVWQATPQAATSTTSYTARTDTSPVVANGLRYLAVWKRAIAEHENGFSHQKIATSFNTENIALPRDPRYSNTKTWTADIVKNLTDWPEGVRLLDRAIAEYESGRTFEQISSDLNMDGMHTSTGKQWTARSLARLMNS